VSKKRNRWAQITSSKYLVFIVLAVLSPVLLAGAGAAQTDMPKPIAKDKCPVCGMFIAKYPDWISTILFKDGSHAFFDGPKDMFKYLLDLKRYNPSKAAGDIKAIRVLDYYAVAPIDAKKAWYVLGSDVFGPMGRELIPLGRESDAKVFMKDHKGTKMVRFSEVTVDVVKTRD